jgi:hypothetical protein
MVGATDQKTEWNLGETIMWIRTRDHDRVALMWDLSEFEAIAVAFFHRQQLPSRVVRTAAVDARARVPIAAAHAEGAEEAKLPGTSATGSQALDNRNGAGRKLRTPVPGRLEQRRPSSADSEPDRILQDLMRKVQTRKVAMTMIRAEHALARRIPVSPGEANELVLRVTENEVAPVIAWSRTQEAMIGTSPWFSRTNVIRAWPELSRKTAAVAGAILRHLNEISTLERPLTKPEARDRCLAEVPNAYPEAFKRAWARLDPSRKRGRGKHGPRAH